MVGRVVPSDVTRASRPCGSRKITDGTPVSLSGKITGETPVPLSGKITGGTPVPRSF